LARTIARSRAPCPSGTGTISRTEVSLRSPACPGSFILAGIARAGRLEEARLVFEKMFTYANHLGLFSEEIDATGGQLGNFPQAFSHLSLISAAVNLDRQLDHGPGRI
jgi:hypothetical protein